MDILELKANLQALDYMSECEDSFNENAGYSEDLNRQQLSAGAKADGTLLPDYSPFTQLIKSKKGQQLDPMNLRDTGNFWKGITHNAKSGVINYDDTDSKTELLTDKYGEQILGLHPTSQEEMIPKWQETLVHNIENKLFGK